MKSSWSEFAEFHLFSLVVFLLAELNNIKFFNAKTAKFFAIPLQNWLQKRIKE